MSRHSPLKSPSWKPAFLRKKIGASASALGGEIEGMKKRLKDTATTFAPAIAGLCDATQTVAAIVPEARELNSYLLAVGTEVDTVIDFLLRELERQTEAVRAGHAAPDLPQSVNEAPRAAEKQ